MRLGDRRRGLGGSDDRWALQDPDREGDKGPHKFEHGLHRESDQPERDAEQPHDRLEEQRQQSERPRHDQKEQPHKERQHDVVSRVATAVRVGWVSGSGIESVMVVVLLVQVCLI